MCHFCLLGFPPLEMLSRMTQRKINQNSLLTLVLVSSERHEDTDQPDKFILAGPSVRGHKDINQPNQFTGVGPCVSRTPEHRPTKPVHWGRSLCSADAGALFNRTSSLGTAPVSRGYKSIDQPKQFTGVGSCVSRAQGHQSTKPVHSGRFLCLAGTRT